MATSAVEATQPAAGGRPRVAVAEAAPPKTPSAETVPRAIKPSGRRLDETTQRLERARKTTALVAPAPRLKEVRPTVVAADAVLP